MANSFFQFKLFTVQQQFCAMKVSTDSCIFGAIVAEVFAEKSFHDTNYLDIGTGTGLLSLMIAQKTIAFIDAVEIDHQASEQAKINFATSPFKERLAVYNSDILHFKPDKKYDGIICNPPFFEGDLQSPDQKKNTAKHDTSLTLQYLLTVANNHLKKDGTLAVLLPYHRVADFIKEAVAQHFYLEEKILLRNTSHHPYFRGIVLLSKINTLSITRHLVIKNEEGNYTSEFITLLKDYYLYL